MMQNYMAENREGNTPLHWACLNGQEQASFALALSTVDAVT